MAQIYQCPQCKDRLSIPDKKVVYAAYCSEGHSIQEMVKISDRLADQAVKAALDILRQSSR